jgi:hypothetical protein
MRTVRDDAPVRPVQASADADRTCQKLAGAAGMIAATTARRDAIRPTGMEPMAISTETMNVLSARSHPTRRGCADECVAYQQVR